MTPNFGGSGGSTLAHCFEMGCSLGILLFRLSAIDLLSTSARTFTVPGRWYRSTFAIDTKFVRYVSVLFSRMLWVDIRFAYISAFASV